MDTSTLIISTIAKIAFVMVIILTFAPVLVWAERRQSAMMQDRIGPVRAGVFLPPIATDIAAILMYVAMFVFCGAAFVALEWSRQGDNGFSLAGWLLHPLFVLTLLGALAHVGIFKLVESLVKNRTRVAILGLLHPLADAIKFIFKEDFVPPKADKALHALAPIVTLIPAILTFAVIPFASALYWEHVTDYVVNLPDGTLAFATAPGLTGEVVANIAQVGSFIPMQVASLNVGILFVFAVAGTGVVGAAIAGYSSDNKYALLGGLRAAGQMVSYEVTLGLTLVPAFMLYNSLLLEDMIGWQTGNSLWGIIPLFPCFILFLTCSIAETKRIPFDLPEAESELAAGYFTEYSGMKFGMFFMAEFVEVVVLSAIVATIFLGGWDVPLLHAGGFVFADWMPLGRLAESWDQLVVLGSGDYLLALPHWGVVALQVGSFLLKLVVLIWLQLQIRWTLPRFRYDQVMRVCWQYILPASLALIAIYGIVILIFDGGN